MVETPTEEEALDAYSVIVSSVAEAVLPSVASLRIGRGGRGFGGAGSGVVITPDGFLVTSAHVVAAGRAASASFIDCTEYDVDVVGADPLSALAGALAGSHARLIGVNTAVAGMGLGLAVPMNATTQAILAALMRNGRVRRAYLGIAGGTRPLPPPIAEKLGRKAGVEVHEVVSGSPAAGGQLRSGDVIVSVGEVGVSKAGDLQRLMVEGKIGSKLPITVMRGDQLLNLTVVPVELT